MFEWQPIEMAPTDGTAIWILVEGQPFIGYCDKSRDGKDFWQAKASFERIRCGGRPDRVFSTLITGINPTHWAPLPEPPVSP